MVVYADVSQCVGYRSGMVGWPTCSSTSSRTLAYTDPYECVCSVSSVHGGSGHKHTVFVVLVHVRSTSRGRVQYSV
jgi:hypothetical protein